MKFVAMFVGGAVLALGITFLTGNLDLGSDSGPVVAQPLPACVDQLDLNGDTVLSVDDGLVLKAALADGTGFDKNGDTVTDVNDVVFYVLEIVDCLQQQQPPPLP